MGVSNIAELSLHWISGALVGVGGSDFREREQLVGYLRDIDNWISGALVGGSDFRDIHRSGVPISVAYGVPESLYRTYFKAEG